MQSTSKEQISNQTLLLKSKLPGCFKSGNYLWGGAMNLCWNSLSKDIIKEDVKLKVTNPYAKHLVQIFNNSQFSKDDLTEDSYYVKAGYGTQIVKLINKEIKQKFPSKTMPPLNITLTDKDIISYAYFLKEVEYLTPFAIESKFYFKDTPVKGFKVKSQAQRKNVIVCKYINDNQFILKLLLKQKNEELFVIKGMHKKLPQEIIESVQKYGANSDRIKKDEPFVMPVLELNVTREYSQLVGKDVLNKNLNGYQMANMLEKIKFKIDEKGAKVENQAVILLRKKKMSKPIELRKFIVDKPFWIVMRQVGKHPYFVCGINNTQWMTQGYALK